MTGYEEFQRIMAEIERKKRAYQTTSNDDMLQNLKDLFGI